MVDLKNEILFHYVSGVLTLEEEVDEDCLCVVGVQVVPIDLRLQDSFLWPLVLEQLNNQEGIGHRHEVKIVEVAAADEQFESLLLFCLTHQGIVSFHCGYSA